MPEQPHESASQLPDSPNLEWLRKQAKSRFAELRRENPEAKLADAQFAIAKQYGFSSWRALKAHLDALTLEGQIIETARKGDVERLARLLDEHPDKLHLNVPPYEASLLFPAAQSGNVDAVQLLLERGLDVNYREKGDNTYVMHWAAAQGHLEMVRTLADAGGDVIGEGDDHAFGVIGWASCWEGCNEDKHRAVVDFLISRGARHHIFSAPVAGYAADPQIDLPVMRKIHELTLSEMDSASRGRRPLNATGLDLVAAAALRDWDLAAALATANPKLTQLRR